MPILKDEDDIGSICLYDISKIPSKFIETHSGFKATHVIIRVNIDESFSDGGIPIKIKGDSKKLKIANAKRSKHGCLDAVLAIHFDCWFHRRRTVIHVNNIIDAMRVY